MMSLQGKHLGIERMCELAQVSRAGYYRYLKERAPKEEETEVRAQIQEIVLAHRRRYGCRRVAQELRNLGLVVNRKRVARIMKDDSLLALRYRKFVPTTDSSHSHQVHLNLAKRMELTGIDQLWVADITYIRLRDEFVFLAVILDAYSRRVIGWALERTIQTRLTMAALHQAIASRRPPAGLVHHSDRGAQYAGGEYIEELLRNGIVPSMSRPGCPYDNAACESFMKTLKQEEIYANTYRDLEHLRANLEAFLDVYYNRKRIHSALGYRSPEAFEAAVASFQGKESRAAKIEFLKASEIYQSDVAVQLAGQERNQPAPLLAHRLDESPTDYSLASCSPAELASASSAGTHCATVTPFAKRNLSER
jgi:putative transposase